MPKTTSALSSTTAKRPPEKRPTDSLEDPLSRRVMTDPLQDDVVTPVRGDRSDDKEPRSLEGPAPSGKSSQVQDEVGVEKRVERRVQEEPEREREEPGQKRPDDRKAGSGSVRAPSTT